MSCILFCPFRTLQDLQKDGSYRVYFKKKGEDNTITERHLQILQNIQDCHNAMDSGSPKNALERCIEAPSKNNQNDSNDLEDTSPEQYRQEMMHQSTLSIEVLDPSSKTY